MGPMNGKEDNGRESLHDLSLALRVSVHILHFFVRLNVSLFSDVHVAVSLTQVCVILLMMHGYMVFAATPFHGMCHCWLCLFSLMAIYSVWL